jgi:hypothetical protein
MPREHSSPEGIDAALLEHEIEALATLALSVLQTRGCSAAEASAEAAVIRRSARGDAAAILSRTPA